MDCPARMRSTSLEAKVKSMIQENFNILSFVLTKDDMDKIDQRALKGARFRLTEEHGLGFSDELDFTYEECWPK